MASRQRTGQFDATLPLQRGGVDVPTFVPPLTPLTRPVAPVGLFSGLSPIAMPPRPSRRDLSAIQASLAAVRGRPVALAEAFYEHLFEMAPAVRALFADDMTAQMQRMTDVLLATLAALQNDAGADEADDPVEHPALERALQALGARHRDRWNIVPGHYVYIAHALTRAVRDVAGSAWSGSLSSSWIALTQWITGHMLVGHDQPPGLASRDTVHLRQAASSARSGPT
jgi:hemoglobin-like flavoprotein